MAASAVALIDLVEVVAVEAHLRAACLVVRGSTSDSMLEYENIGRELDGLVSKLRHAHRARRFVS